VILETGKIFDTNLYSYTHPDRHAPNHHWLFGVITYLIHQTLGFSGITLLTAALYTASVILILRYIGKKYGRIPLIASALLILPIATDRSEVRPEAFSLFFFALELVVLLYWQEKKIANRIMVLVFFAIAALWVNIHIFFFMSFILIGCFGVSALIEKDWQKVSWLSSFALAALIGTLCNPLFITGALYPTQILQEYGYPIAENQTPYFFLHNYTTNFHYYLVSIFLLTVVSIGGIVFKSRMQHSAILLTCATYFVFTNKLIRFSNFFALVAALIFAILIALVLPKLRRIYTDLSENLIALSATSLVVFSLLAILLTSGLFMPFTRGIGLGVFPGVNKSAEFFKQLTVSGPIFNNFDIGGYLIYHLYPRQQVYVDNRAEAYPADFLVEYKVAQLDRTVWEKLDDQYQFGAIYFSRLERTEWGQQFLITTIQDSRWAPIYVDDFTIIFVRDIPEHQDIIKKYKLPEEMFKISEQ
jgi:MFS family permease